MVFTHFHLHHLSLLRHRPLHRRGERVRPPRLGGGVAQQRGASVAGRAGKEGDPRAGAGVRRFQAQEAGVVARQGGAARKPAPNFDDMDDDIPF